MLERRDKLALSLPATTCSGGRRLRGRISLAPCSSKLLPLADQGLELDSRLSRIWRSPLDKHRATIFFKRLSRSALCGAWCGRQHGKVKLFARFMLRSLLFGPWHSFSHYRTALGRCSKARLLICILSHRTHTCTAAPLEKVLGLCSIFCLTNLPYLSESMVSALIEVRYLLSSDVGPTVVQSASADQTASNGKAAESAGPQCANCSTQVSHFRSHISLS